MISRSSSISLSYCCVGTLASGMPFLTQLEPPDGFGRHVPRIIQAALERQLRVTARSDLVPAMPRLVSGSRLLTISGNHLGDGSNKLCRGALQLSLFNFCIIPRMPEMLTGGRYPTPRHIARAMANLLALQPGETLADLACGSGGLLVAAAEPKPGVTGVKISPNWARIAWANAVLHDLPKPDIRIGNTFAVFSEPSPQPAFDCILMNPPFGEVVDRELADRSFGTPEWGGHAVGRSETLLTSKALNLLKPGGRLAVLLPSGPLFARGGADQDLRESSAGPDLRAVIGLPKDAFQPYSSSQTHLLLVRNPADSDIAQRGDIWFYRVSHDGFTSGRNRLPEPEKDELPWLEATILSQDDPAELHLKDDEPLWGLRTIRKDAKTLAYRFTWKSGGRLTLHRLARAWEPFQLAGRCQDTRSRHSRLYPGTRGTRLQRLGEVYRHTAQLPSPDAYIRDLATS